MYLINECKFVNDVYDLRELVNEDVFRAMESIVAEKNEELKAGDNYELIADGYYQQLNQTTILVNDFISYIDSTKRLNRNTIVNKLKEISNTLENY